MKLLDRTPEIGDIVVNTRWEAQGSPLSRLLEIDEQGIVGTVYRIETAHKAEVLMDNLRPVKTY